MKRNGFSLIELMVVLVVIGILASVAIPSYNRNIQSGYRSDAIGVIQEILSAQERFYTDELTYTKTLKTLGLQVNSSGQYETRDVRYKIEAQSCSGYTLKECVEIVAKAQGEQAGDGNLIANTMGRQDRILDGTTLEW